VTNERAHRDDMSATKKPESHRRTTETHECIKLEDFAEIRRWQEQVNRQLEEGNAEVNSLAVSIEGLAVDTRDMRRSQSDMGRSQSETLAVILREISNLNQRTATMLEVAAADRNKRDIQNKTPGRPVLSLPGGASLKAGPWTIVGVVFVITMFAIPAGAWTYVAVRGIAAKVESAK
jgi:hypothetical protein